MKTVVGGEINGYTKLQHDTRETSIGRMKEEAKAKADENGRIVIEGLEPGVTITAKEIKTLEGYVLDTTPKSIKIKVGEAQGLPS